MAQQYFDEEKFVFFNKLGIENQEELEKWEYGHTEIRMRELLENPQLIKTQSFNLDRQKEIHAHLFGDIYEWAGKIRTVPLKKLNHNREMAIFAEPEQIERNWQNIEKQVNKFLSGSLSFQEKVSQLADIFVQINQTHAFPEGNGRTTQIFMKQLANEQGIDLDYTKVNPNEWNIACSMICERHKTLRFEGQTIVLEEEIPVDKEPLKKIFSEIVREKQTEHIQQQIDAEFVKQLCQPDFALRKAALHDLEISQALLERTAIHHKCPQTRKAAAAVLQQRGIEISTSNKPNTVPSKTVNKDKGIEI
ncbi:MAG: Fic family protein [Neisseriaceae bacterium]|nr:Fic family protein [Neisseriaceae bacterium]MBQ9724757.1 Fic family protein [Neisseriaceae bacterium]